MSEKKTTFGADYQKKIIENTDEKQYQIGEYASQIVKAYGKELEKMLNSHNRLKGIYYIYIIHHKDPMFQAAHKITFCSMREKDLHKAPMHFGSDMWEVNNDNGELFLKWALPPMSKIDRVLKNPSDVQTYNWVVEALRQRKLRKEENARKSRERRNNPGSSGPGSIILGA